MKAFIFDLISKLHRESNSLDAKATLCNKTWRVFSDTGEKEVYIFMEDGKLVISSNGLVEMGTWMYVPANQSLVLTGKQNYLVHPVICNNILALIVDGTNQCAFLLDDTKRELDAVKSLQNLSSYISSNINKMPVNNSSNHVFTTSSSRPFVQNVGNGYAFGEFGTINEYGTYQIDLRQLKRISGQFARAKYDCDIVNPSSSWIRAFSSDYDTSKSLSTFEVKLEEGVLSMIYYNCLKTGARAVIFIFEKSFLGLNKKYEKRMNYHLPNSNEVQDDEQSWFNRCGEDLRKDIAKYRGELEALFGFSDIYGLFIREKYTIW